MCHETQSIQEKNASPFVFPKQLNHIVLTKGLVSFGVVQTESSDPFEFNVKWGGAKVPPFLLPKKGMNPGRRAYGRSSSVLVFVEEEVLFGRVVWPDVLDGVE